MKTGNECLVCFLRQAMATAGHGGQDEKAVRKVVLATASLLNELEESRSPPENAVRVYAEIARLTGIADPYAEAKQASTNLALQLRAKVRQRIASAGDPLYAACRYAIAANIIDYGTRYPFDAQAALGSCLQAPLAVDDYHVLRKTLADGAEVLYLADNCGELVFDGLVVEELQKIGCRVTLAVRGGVILNDATMTDVEPSGISCRVMASGLACPGTPIGKCSPQLQAAFAGADVIISKGQGNFETLSDTPGPLFYLLTVKCPVVAGHIAECRGPGTGPFKGDGEMILMAGRSFL